MVRQKSGGYYRVRVLKEESTRVRIGNSHACGMHTSTLLMAAEVLKIIFPVCIALMDSQLVALNDLTTKGD